MSNELAGMVTRLEAWQQAIREIQQQIEHNWTLELIDKGSAKNRIQEGWQLSDDLRTLADKIERQAEQVTAVLEDDE
jgi:hypothetical protein